MRRSIPAVLLAVSSALVLAACSSGTCERDMADLKQEIKKLQVQVQQLRAPVVSLSGYGKTRWGMSPAKVKTLHKAAKPFAGGKLLMKGEVAGKSAEILFTFMGGKLTHVTVDFPGDDDYYHLKDLLRKKYGVPEASVDRWDRMLSIWKTDKTKVTLSQTREDGELTLRIRYASRGLEEMQRQAFESGPFRGL